MSKGCCELDIFTHQHFDGADQQRRIVAHCGGVAREQRKLATERCVV